MPRLNLKVVGNRESRCNSSDPRYMRENRYANPCSTENFLRFQVTRLSITLLIFQNVVERPEPFHRQNYEKVVTLATPSRQVSFLKPCAFQSRAASAGKLLLRKSCLF